MAHIEENESTTCISSQRSVVDSSGEEEMASNVIPEIYALPLSERPLLQHQPPPSNLLPVIDLTSLHDSSGRSSIVNQLELACKKFGIFQVINHGIPVSVMKDALTASSEFFDLPDEEKMKLASSNVYEPVRYGTSHNFENEKIKYWRAFIKHYCHPLSSFIHLWPSNPPTYKEKMGTFAKAAHFLQKQLSELVFESLGLSPDYMSNEIEGGCQCMIICMTMNCYDPCPQPELSLGAPAHTDHGTITILLQNHQGLEMMDHDHQEWHSVPFVEGALVIQLGDQLEILSNGRYKAVMHRAVLNSAERRVSIASVHSLALEKKVSPAPKIVNEDQVLRYKEGCFLEFLDFISGKFGKDISKEKYIDILKMKS